MPVTGRPGLYELTQREKDIFRLLLKGYTERETAEELGLTKNTVHKYRNTVYDKIGTEKIPYYGKQKALEGIF